ncbi:MAG: isochorismatase family protein [Defluviicoccus sp.]|nr:isochorismatase family protein [Defluviicoccus sp.]MDE0279015.1 isochorismatase family protein [Defluviicoccus sp.]
MAGDLDIYEKQGFGNRIGFGEKPALIVIDFINAFNDPDMFGGGSIQSAIDHTEDLLGLARHLDLPIAFTSHVYADDRSEDGIFNMKSPGLSKLVPNTRATAIVDQLEPRPGERVIGKHYPSGFFATDLANWLARRGVDTAIVTGCTTSGCVRATVVDAMGHGFRPIVPAECSGDRAQGPHEANLFDMDQKYADVMPLSEVQAALTDLAQAQAGPAEEET